MHHWQPSPWTLGNVNPVHQAAGTEEFSGDLIALAERLASRVRDRIMAVHYNCSCACCLIVKVCLLGPWPSPPILEQRWQCLVWVKTGGTTHTATRVSWSCLTLNLAPLVTSFPSPSIGLQLSSSSSQFLQPQDNHKTITRQQQVNDLVFPLKHQLTVSLITIRQQKRQQQDNHKTITRQHPNYKSADTPWPKICLPSSTQLFKTTKTRQQQDNHETRRQQQDTAPKQVTSRQNSPFPSIYHIAIE